MNSILDTIGIDPGILIMILIIVTLGLMIITLNLSISVHRLKRKYGIFMRGQDAQSLERVFTNKMKEIDRLTSSNDMQVNEIRNLNQTMDKTLTKHGVVKYDAFDDVGGKLSFVLSMLDKDDTGIILNVIHSKENCFLYIKEIVKGESYVMLSEEEQIALERASSYASEDFIM
jgi:hypothetical protein